MKGIRKLVVASGVLAVLIVGASAPAAPASESALAPISEGSWLGEINAECSDETGTTNVYECSFEGSAPAEFPSGSFCAETPSAIAVSFDCAASITATTVGRLGKAGCLNTPPPHQLTTANGTVTIFSTVTQQSYAVPVKVWVTRGAGKFSGVGNYLLSVAKVSGGFTTTCGILQSRGTFQGEFSLATTER